jgi:transcriptional regulator with XRE-family HTH domain
MGTADAKQLRLGAKVHGLRRQKGLSQVQLAERLEISRCPAGWCAISRRRTA